MNVYELCGGGRLNRQIHGVASTQQYITLSSLNRLWRKLKTNGLLYKIDRFDKNYLYLAVRVLKTNGLDYFKSYKIVNQLGIVVKRIQNLTLYAVKVGSIKLHEMIRDKNYSWAETTLGQWLKHDTNCLTVGLKELKFID